MSGKKVVISTIALRWGALLVVMVLAPLFSLGQNLLNNGGFENFSALPSAYAQSCFSQGWTSASGACALTPGCGHPDYFHLTGAATVRPPNLVYGTCMPHSGNAMMGFSPWYPTTPNFREYLRFTLATPLIVGQPYTVTFWTSNGTNPYVGWGSNNLGLAFSTVPLTQTCGAPITTVIPQVEINTIVYSSTWQAHSFTFTPTQPYTNLCIGNFHMDAATTAVQMSSGWQGAYYFIDDVSVEAVFPLPVEMSAFEVTCAGDGSTELTWSTASESENDHFEIQRTVGEAEPTIIATVPGAWNSTSRHDYRFMDTEPVVGERYYRILQVDGNGARTTSEMRAISCEQKAEVLRVWPVPSNGDVQVGFASVPDGAILQVFDARGALVRSFPVAAGARSLVLDGLSTGMYTMHLKGSIGTALHGRCVIW
ncbi:MAG: T9SS type A sorting domain-containing protein [Flavobacteriales bacterium]|nr:T9SS type A sorting domain-containing protein [Flavobacteriales bacterium]